MSLNNSKMLPARVRNMRQMSDVLNAEDIILTEIEWIIDEMYQRASLLHEETVNEIWLEEKLEKLINGIVYVTKQPNLLCVEIKLNVGKITDEREKTVVEFIEKWLPAHLAYNVIYEKILEAEVSFACVWQNDEMMILREVVL